MRILNIRLTNFAGVDSSYVEFATSGVTVVDGPNEIGKSTLFYALDLLFDSRDSSKSQAVNRVLPVHSDTGPEVEAELQIGSYQFKYSKRFQKSPFTKLDISTPKVESLTGRDAHDRALEILESNLDTGLWKALRIVQGENTDLPDLHGQPALSQALGIAAGQVNSIDGHHQILDAARDEYSRFWTPTGREKPDPIGNTRKALEDSERYFEESKNRLREVETEIQRFSELENEITAAHDSAVATSATLKELEDRWAQVSEIISKVKLLESESKTAGIQFSSAKAAVDTRTNLIQTVSDQSESLNKQIELVEGLRSISEQAAQRLTEATSVSSEIHDSHQAAVAELSSARAHRDFRNNELVLAQMSERRTRIREAETNAEDAVKVIAGNSVTREVRDAMRDAYAELAAAQALMESAAPELAISPHDGTTITLDGREISIPIGGSKSIKVPESVELGIGEHVTVSVSSGERESNIQLRFDEAKRLFEDLLSNAGVNDLDEAENALIARQEAERTIRNRDTVVTENLRDLSREELDDRILGVQNAIETFKSLNTNSSQLPSNLDDAEELLSEADKRAAELEKKLKSAQAAENSARDIRDKTREETIVAETLLNRIREDSNRDVEMLDSARKGNSDDELNKELTAAETRIEKSTAELSKANEELKTADPDGIEDRVATARAANKGAEEREQQLRTERVVLRSKLDTLGEQGLAEATDNAEADSRHLTNDLDRLSRHADAAKLLFEVLDEERDSAQQHYVAPLREKIRQLGRYIFNDSFDVEIDDDLRVVRRTLDGLTLPFDSLSTGAKEQIGLLVRLAVSCLVDTTGGVPVVLDDTLGSTDRVRLEGAGVAISVAAKNSQVILLTSMPERYQHIDIRSSTRL